MDLNSCWKKLCLVVVNPLVLELNAYSDLLKLELNGNSI